MRVSHTADNAFVCITAKNATGDATLAIVPLYINFNHSRVVADPDVNPRAAKTEVSDVAGVPKEDEGRSKMGDIGMPLDDYPGVVGIKDPIRSETREAVRKIKQAGVTVRVVTDDNALTATYIARESGILDDDGIVMEGPDFRKVSEEEKQKDALKLQLLARSTLNDKLVHVRQHKKLGEVTSVTGDGTNGTILLSQ